MKKMILLYSKSFKINIDGQNFFLKVEHESIVAEGGFQEMESTLLAKDEIKKYGYQIISFK